MPRGSPAIKLAITVDSDVHAKVLRAAREDELSVSAWMTAAARQVLRVREGLEAIAEWEEEHGAFTEAELEAARARIRSGSPKAGKRRSRPRKART